MSKLENEKTYYPAVSSNTLFHFTNKREYLIKILQNNYRSRYCFENLSSVESTSPLKLGRIHDFAIPMLCFCDLPLSLTGKHLAEYGNYGIGMTKEWGMHKGLNPILYVHQESTLKASLTKCPESINHIEFDIKKLNPKEKDYILKNVDQLWDTFDYIKFFTKPYEGPFHRNGQVKTVRFYDEREWRFVPQHNENSSWRKYLYEGEFTDKTIREEQNDLIFQDDSAALFFNPDNVKYIIVSNESEILNMAEEIEEIKSGFTYAQRKLLITRIISAEQIREDF